jgi:hypothetical protein
MITFIKLSIAIWMIFRPELKAVIRDMIELTLTITGKNDKYNESEQVLHF